MMLPSSSQPRSQGWAFSSIDLVGQCLLDQERSMAFNYAILPILMSVSNLVPGIELTSTYRFGHESNLSKHPDNKGLRA